MKGNTYTLKDHIDCHTSLKCNTLIHYVGETGNGVYDRIQNNLSFLQMKDMKRSQNILILKTIACLTDVKIVGVEKIKPNDIL